MKWRVLISILLTLQVFQPPASAEISDFIRFPYNVSTTFDKESRYGTDYTDSIGMPSWDRLRKGPAPWTGSLSIIFGQNVNNKQYTFEVALKSPSGKIIPLPRTSEYIQKYEYSVYCYRTTCQTQMLKYAANLPIDSEVGKYSLIFTARWVGVKCTGTVCESNVPISKSIEAPEALEIVGESSPTPTPTPTVTASRLAKKTTITCVKGKLVKKVTAVSPKCPAGYKKK